MKPLQKLILQCIFKFDQNVAMPKLVKCQLLLGFQAS